MEVFQLAVDASITLLTLVLACKNTLGEITVYVEDVGSHLSAHTLILSPLPTLHLRPFSNQMLGCHDTTPSKGRVVSK